MASAVYFVKDTLNGNIKIGYSSTLRTRIAGIKSGDGSNIELLFIIHGDKDTENYYHTKFYHDHIIGDWFRPSEDLMKFINEQLSKTSKEDLIKLLEDSSTPQVTITKEQDALIRELAAEKWGIIHGNRSRYVREAIDEKIEREKNQGKEIEQLPKVEKVESKQSPVIRLK